MKSDRYTKKSKIKPMVKRPQIAIERSAKKKEDILRAKPIKKLLFSILDLLLLPITFSGGLILKRMRLNRFKFFPKTKHMLYKLGIFPIVDHYYEPLFNPKYIRHSLRIDRHLSSIDLNINEQLKILNKFNCKEELLDIPLGKSGINEYYYDNNFFMSGDGEYLYNMIRTYKPKKIIEIGSGFSTLMTMRAIRKNKTEDKDYNCSVICVEPFERPWLEELNVTVIRSIVQDIKLSVFETLNENDILFIDSSHIIKPQGDLLFLYLHVVPNLKSGVMVHVHDIFTPKDYLDDWILEQNRFWNEQYLVEAFLSYNNQFKIIGAVNFLRHSYYEQLSLKCPVMAKQIENGIPREPGSFWMQRT